MLYELVRGIGGIVYEPYIGAKKNGIKGGSIGMVKGIGGVVARPIKGCFDFVAQPIVGAINTPSFIYKRLKHKKDPTTFKITNFKIFENLDHTDNEATKLLLYDNIKQDNPDIEFLECIEQEVENDELPTIQEIKHRDETFEITKYIASINYDFKNEAEEIKEVKTCTDQQKRASENSREDMFQSFIRDEFSSCIDFTLD